MFRVDNLINYLPELIILFTTFILIIFSFFHNKILNKYSNTISIISLFIGLVYTILFPIYPTKLYNHFFKIMILLSSLIVALFPLTKRFQKNIIRFNILYLGVVFFSLMITNSKDLLSLYVNIELLNILLYFILSFDKYKISYSETIKYMVSSNIASSFLLLGISFIYGLTGGLRFDYIYQFINISDNYSFSTYIIPFFFILSGLFFKVGVFPFGRWMIDIFTNIDTKIVAFLSIIPKLAILTGLIKIIGIFYSFETSFIVILFCIFTSLFGALYGLNTKNVKTIMACSSYVNMSYILIGISLYTNISIAAVMFYCFTYIFMNLGAFLCIQTLEHSNHSNAEYCFEGYFYKNPLFATCFGVSIISLLGLPISSGFIAKIYLFAAIINSGIIAFPIIIFIILSIIISTVFYLNIIKKMFTPLYYSDYRLIKTKTQNKLLLYFCTLVTILIGIFPMWLIKLCEGIARFI